MYIEFNVSGLLRGDQKSRYESYALGRQWGWLSTNDIRRMENLPPIAGGDKYLTPLNMVDSAKILPAISRRQQNSWPKSKPFWPEPDYFPPRGMTEDNMTTKLINLPHGRYGLWCAALRYPANNGLCESSAHPRIQGITEDAVIQMALNPGKSPAAEQVQPTGGVAVIPVHGILVPRRGRLRRCAPS